MANGRTTKSFTRHLPKIAQILVGLPLVVFGLNGFFNFVPPPATPLPEAAAAFAGALAKTGYMMQLIGATQLIVGLLLVLNRFVPLAFTPGAFVAADCHWPFRATKGTLDHLSAQAFSFW